MLTGLFIFVCRPLDQLVEALCYKPEVAVSIPDEVIGFFC
jgi:hypothetical protein